MSIKHSSGFTLIGDPSSRQITQFETALAYLKKSPTARGILDEMLLKKVSITFSTTGVDIFNPSRARGGIGTNGYDSLYEENTVVWSPDLAIAVLDNNFAVRGIMSSAIALIHEGAHSIDPYYEVNYKYLIPEQGVPIGYDNGREVFATDRKSVV